MELPIKIFVFARCLSDFKKMPQTQPIRSTSTNAQKLPYNSENKPLTFLLYYAIYIEKALKQRSILFRYLPSR
jgi:hypothetical protein